MYKYFILISHWRIIIFQNSIAWYGVFEYMCSHLGFLTHYEIWILNITTAKKMELKFQEVYFGEQQGKNGKRKGFESPPKLGMTLSCAYVPLAFTYLLLVVCHFDTGRLLWGWEQTAVVSDKEENRCPASALMAATLCRAHFKERVTECELDVFCSESCYIHKVATFFTTLTAKFYQGQSSASIHSAMPTIPARDRICIQGIKLPNREMM